MFQIGQTVVNSKGEKAKVLDILPNGNVTFSQFHATVITDYVGATYNKIGIRAFGISPVVEKKAKKTVAKKTVKKTTKK